MKNNKLLRIGEVGTNRLGSKMIIVEYNHANDIIVEFEEGVFVHTSYGNFCKGNVKNVYDRSIFNIGYIGDGDYSISIKGRETSHGKAWRSMLQRCYDIKLHDRHPTYKGCTVVEEWHNFQNFAKWYDENYYEVEGQRMDLDKDILVKGNKIYSPDTCVFVPQCINTLFVKNNIKRGDLPIGVNYHKTSGKYLAKCRNLDKKQIHLGSFDTPERAFKCYKSYKEDIIRSVAEQYRDRVPTAIYFALMSYVVNIDD